MLRLLLVVLALASCKKAAPEVDPAFAPSVAKVKASLASLPKIKQAVDATPPLQGDTLALPNGKKESSTLLTVDQLTSLGSCFPDAAICNDLWWRLSECDAAAKLTGEQAAADFGAMSNLKRCATLRYVAVARKRAFTKPVVDKGSNTYSPGSLSVELLVFDLESAAYLGGFIVDAKNPETAPSETNVEKYLQDQLGRVVFDAMRARIDS